jgi:hypothetical protein
MSKKIQNILSLIEIAENNLSNAKIMLTQVIGEKSDKTDKNIYDTEYNDNLSARRTFSEDPNVLESMEGYFDGENMLGDNGKNYTVPQNYASKTQLVIGDRMKWSLTPDKELFKLIDQAERERLVGQFSMEGENYIVVTDKYEEPVKILKASATFAMKNMGLTFGDEVVLIVPKNITPSWGAFSSVVKSLSEQEKKQIEAEIQQTNASKNTDMGDKPPILEERAGSVEGDDIMSLHSLKENAKIESKLDDDGLEFDYI